MSYHVSTGLRNAMLDDGCLSQALSPGFIMIYGGPVPADADAALDAANHLLVTISNAGTATGLMFEGSAVNGGLSKKVDEVWSGTVTTTGEATFYRHIGAGEHARAIGELSTTRYRLQGAAGLYGAELNFPDGVTMTAGTIKTLDYYYVGLPTL